MSNHTHTPQTVPTSGPTIVCLESVSRHTSRCHDWPLQTPTHPQEKLPHNAHQRNACTALWSPQWGVPLRRAARPGLVACLSKTDPARSQEERGDRRSAQRRSETTAAGRAASRRRQRHRRRPAKNAAGKAPPEPPARASEGCRRQGAHRHRRRHGTKEVQGGTILVLQIT